MSVKFVKAFAPIAMIGALGACASSYGEGAAGEGAAPYVGRWAVDAAWCANKPGETDALPIRITERRFLGYENECDIVSVAAGSGGNFEMSRQCVGEGVSYSDEILLSVDGDRMTIISAARRATEFVRCGDA